MKKYWQYSTAESFKNCYSLRHIKLREKCWSDESHTGDWLAHLAGGPTLTFALKPKASDNSTTLCHRLIYFQTSGDNPSIFNCQFLKGQWLWATFAQLSWGSEGKSGFLWWRTMRLNNVFVRLFFYVGVCGSCRCSLVFPSVKLQ